MYGNVTKYRTRKPPINITRYITPTPPPSLFHLPGRGEGVPPLTCPTLDHVAEPPVHPPFGLWT